MSIREVLLHRKRLPFSIPLPRPGHPKTKQATPRSMILWYRVGYLVGLGL